MDNMENNVNKTSNGLAIAGMVVGIISVAFPFYSISGVVGLVLSCVGYKKSKEVNKGRGMAIAGISCSVVGIIIGIMQILLIVAAFSFLADNSHDIIRLFEDLDSLTY